MGKPRMNHRVSGSRRGQPQPAKPRELRATIESIRKCLEEADQILGLADNEKDARTAVIYALWGILRCFGSFTPPIPSVALYKHLEDLQELFVGRVASSLTPTRGGRRGPPQERQAQDGMIAAAVTVLSKGGERKGNLTRKEACLFVSNALNKIGISTHGHRFTASRVENIYLEVIRKQSRRPKRTNMKGDRPALLAAVEDVIIDRRRRLAQIVYDDILKVIRSGTDQSGGSYSLDRRKKLARGLLSDVERIANGFAPRAERT